ncbi:MAG: NIL domain-containing protein [Planctomycetota bacterium]
MPKASGRITKHLKLVFPMRYKRTPILFRLASDFGIEFNLIEGRFSENDAWVIATFIGKPKNIDEALNFLKSNKIEVTEVKK